MSRSALTLLALLLPVACGDSPVSAPPTARAGPDGPPLVLATTLPLATFAERILGGAPPVRCIVPAGERADVWRPSRDELAGLQSATLVLTNGAGLEPWLEIVSLPATRIVDASAGLADALRSREELAHTHGLRGERSRPPADPYVWLDLDLAARQVNALSEAFASRWPSRVAVFEARAQALTDELGALDARLSALSDQGAPPRLLASEPLYAYLGRAHGWTVRVVDLDPDGPPTRAVEALLEAALAAGATPVLLWPRAPSPATAQLVTERHGLRSVVLAPGLALSREELEHGVNFLDLLEAGISALEEALGR